eukprot:TRINITY_DN34289_c0_g1_i1.p1 TRINITY_DN34289_c0_g1~~TRINITY_DN34289_c0_g1_i1.p1  ORF type:complete len:370 (+),score=43.20 TRINITY_DN34289_c0_g1_i1:60-1112(+)
MALTCLEAFAKVLLSPMFFLIKYNCDIGFFDNVVSYLFFIIEPFLFGWPGLPEKEEEEKLQATQRFFRSGEARIRECIKKKDNVSLEEYETMTADGTPLKLYVTRPASSEPATRWPVIVYFHGGGMAIGTPLDDVFMDLVTHYGSECLVASPDYRVGAEGGKYPAAFDDCLAVMKHFTSQNHKLILSGQSAGAYLTLKSGLLARDAGIPLQALIPIAPLTHVNSDTSRARNPSCKRHGGFGWLSKSNTLSLNSVEAMARCWVRPSDRKTDDHDIRKANLTGLPPCTIVGFVGDCLYDEGTEIHEKILKAGGDSKFISVKASHSYGCIVLGIKAAEAAFRQALSAPAQPST